MTPLNKKGKLLIGTQLQTVIIKSISVSNNNQNLFKYLILECFAVTFLVLNQKQKVVVVVDNTSASDWSLFLPKDSKIFEL